MKTMKKIILASIITLTVIGCSAQNTNSDREDDRRPPRGERGGPPSVEEIFKMDANKDGKLAKSEIKGPLRRDFEKVDTNKDGFITKTELKNAPKPERGQGPPPRRNGAGN